MSMMDTNSAGFLLEVALVRVPRKKRYICTVQCG